VFRLRQTLDHFFPDLYGRLEALTEVREAPRYRLVEVLLGAIALFLFKEGSRNAFNNERQERKFLKNYRQIFKVRLPHMDTVDEVLRLLQEAELERLKAELVAGLLEKKVFQKYKFLDQYYRVVVDGTQVVSVAEGHCEHCLTKTSKGGKVSYFHNVLEAKLVCENGFCVSLATEWIENPAGDFDKQDCERRAFARLAPRLKAAYPRLPICVVADALYPNQTFFALCAENQWEWIVTFKEGNLPSVWEEVAGLQSLGEQHERRQTLRHQHQEMQRHFRWINAILYHTWLVHWYECVETSQKTSTRFVYLSSLPVDYFQVLDMTHTGRLRWKIENEGFNIQKNQGYGLTHLYSRVSLTALKNYYQCLQIAHLINQLFELGSLGQSLLQGKMTWRHLWKKMLGEMRERLLPLGRLQSLLAKRIQIRFG
jgi:hypothetical protein